MMVEQLGSQKYRMRYNATHGTFIETDQRFLGYARGFVGIYGWIVGYGTPPREHLDVIVPTGTRYSLGDGVPIRIIGCFMRNDNDHKFVGVELHRMENTLCELPDEDSQMLRRLYPKVRNGEAWLEREDAVELILGRARI